MSTTGDLGTQTELAPYVEAVRTRIAGLSPPQQTDVLQDLHHYLAELMAEPAEAETSVPVAQRLGDPDDFAVEYLSSAGLDLSPEPSPVGVIGEEPSPETTPTRSTGWLSQPSMMWWFIRGWLLPGAYAVFAGDSFLLFLDPAHNNEHWRDLALVTLATTASVWIGTEARERGRFGQVNRLLTAATLLAAAAIISDLYEDSKVISTSDFPSAVQQPLSPGQLVSAEGNPITNLYVYDSSGNLLQDVFIYDQAGRPVTTPQQHPNIQTQVPLDANGTAIANQYPQAELIAGKTIPAPSIITPARPDPSHGAPTTVVTGGT